MDNSGRQYQESTQSGRHRISSYIHADSRSNANRGTHENGIGKNARWENRRKESVEVEGSQSYRYRSQQAPQYYSTNLTSARAHGHGETDYPAYEPSVYSTHKRTARVGSGNSSSSNGGGGGGGGGSGRSSSRKPSRSSAYSFDSDSCSNSTREATADEGYGNNAYESTDPQPFVYKKQVQDERRQNQVYSYTGLESSERYAAQHTQGARRAKPTAKKKDPSKEIAEWSAKRRQMIEAAQKIREERAAKRGNNVQQGSSAGRSAVVSSRKYADPVSLSEQFDYNTHEGGEMQAQGEDNSFDDRPVGQHRSAGSRRAEHGSETSRYSAAIKGYIESARSPPPSHSSRRTSARTHPSSASSASSSASSRRQRSHSRTSSASSSSSSSRTSRRMLDLSAIGQPDDQFDTAEKTPLALIHQPIELSGGQIVKVSQAARSTIHQRQVSKPPARVPALAHRHTSRAGANASDALALLNRKRFIGKYGTSKGKALVSQKDDDDDDGSTSYDDEVTDEDDNDIDDDDEDGDDDDDDDDDDDTYDDDSHASAPSLSRHSRVSTQSQRQQARKKDERPPWNDDWAEESGAFPPPPPVPKKKKSQLYTERAPQVEERRAAAQRNRRQLPSRNDHNDDSIDTLEDSYSTRRGTHRQPTSHSQANRQDITTRGSVADTEAMQPSPNSGTHTRLPQSDQELASIDDVPAIAQRNPFKSSGIPQELDAHPTENLQLVPCAVCGRSFAADRIEKHMNVCKKVSKSKRKTFKIEIVPKEAQQLKKTAEKLAPKSSRYGNDGKKVKGIPKWKLQHQQFQNMIRRRRALQSGDLETVAQIDSHEAELQQQALKQCPSCGRRFNDSAYKIHTKVCKSVFGKKNASANRRAAPSRRR